MKAEYDLIEKPNPSGDGTPQPLYPRLVSTGKITTRRLLQGITEASTYTMGDLEGALKLIADHAASYIRDGYTVQLGDLGYLSGSLKAKHPVMDKKDIRSTVIYLDHVNFRASKSFINRCSGKLSRTTRGFRKSTDIGRDKRIERLNKYLDENFFITRPEYSRITGLLKNRALAELKELAEAGMLMKKGRGVKLIFIRNREKE